MSEILDIESITARLAGARSFHSDSVRQEAIEQDFHNHAVTDVTNLLLAVERLTATLRMVREELVFGGDWKTAQHIIDTTLAKYTKPPS